MPAIIIDLSDDQLARLRELAAGWGETPEEFVARRVDALVAAPPAGFDAAADYVLRKNAELYRRLA